MIKVFYAGVWDLLHVGHVRALEEAKRLGDWLCVGVITDDQVASYKERPVIPQRERMELVAALRCVDEVVYQDSWFANIDFLAVNGYSIRCVSPQFGTDHPVQVEVRRLCREVGVEYRVLSYTPGISTTIIKERIRDEESSTGVGTGSGSGVGVGINGGGCCEPTRLERSARVCGSPG